MTSSKIPGVMNINGVAVEAFPDIVNACVERNWEFVGHGLPSATCRRWKTNAPTSANASRCWRSATGKRPRGWLGPGLTETWETPDILAEEGYDYVADWVLDDQPVWMKTRGKPILNIPYTQECNDVAMMLIQHHKASEFYERAMDQFEQIYKDAKGSARVMAISVHPYIMGAPHRAKYFRKIFEKIRKKKDVLFWTGAQIADWYKKARPQSAGPTVSWPGLSRPSTSCIYRLSKRDARHKAGHDGGEYWQARMTSAAKFLDKKTIAEQTARMYLDIGAVRFMQDKPFIFTSGWASPVYNDLRWLISFPQVRSAHDGFRGRHHRRATSAATNSMRWRAARPPASPLPPGWPSG